MIWLFDIIMLVVDVHLKYIGVYLFSFKYLSNKMSLLVQMLTSTMMKTEHIGTHFEIPWIPNGRFLKLDMVLKLEDTYAHGVKKIMHLKWKVA